MNPCLTTGRSPTVLSLRDHSFKTSIIDWMIFDLHGQPFDRRIKAGALGDGPTLENPVEFRAKIIVQPGGGVLLDDVCPTYPPDFHSSRFWRALEMPFLLVLGLAIGKPQVRLLGNNYAMPDCPRAVAFQV